MEKFQYRVTIRVGFYTFHNDFEYEQPALDCFQAISSQPDVEIEGDGGTVAAHANVDDVSIRRYPVRIDVGNPNRR